MHLPRSRALVDSRGGRFSWLDESPSTNSAVRETASSGAPAFSVVATSSQTEGRGRLGRTWIAPPGQTLAVSLLLRPTGAGTRDLTGWGWFPLVAGLAMARAIGELAPKAPATVKWPNDVLIDGRKVCGVLTELIPSGDALIVGAGVNLTIPADELPTSTSTSLALEGVDERGDALVDAVLSGWLLHLLRLYDAFSAHGNDADASGIRAAVVAGCGTIGRSVTVELASGPLRGTATGIDADGRLIVARTSDGAPTAVAAGDVTHLR